MGESRFGAPQELITWMRTTHGVDTFIETGTYQGGTAAWASGFFKQVITIEGSLEFHRAARERHADLRNIDFLVGDTTVLLAEALARTPGRPAILWLDAHWMPGSYGSAPECPVLQEIAAVTVRLRAFRAKDDARLFMAPPPRPHRAADWPTSRRVAGRAGCGPRPATLHHHP